MRSQFWGPRIAALDPNMTLLLALEPFDLDYLSHGVESAWPPDRSHTNFPSVLDIQWSKPSLDDTMASTVHSISEAIIAAALAEGQDLSNATKYPGYALSGEPLENLYGGHVKRLHKIRKAIDPEEVMGLAGGWKF
jgi:hypothetical protein